MLLSSDNNHRSGQQRHRNSTSLEPSSSVSFFSQASTAGSGHAELPLFKLCDFSVWRDGGELGRGYSGVVHRGIGALLTEDEEDILESRLMALKVSKQRTFCINHEAFGAPGREFETLKLLHAHGVPVPRPLRFCMTSDARGNGRTVVMMELVDGVTLRDWINAQTGCVRRHAASGRTLHPAVTLDTTIDRLAIAVGLIDALEKLHPLGTFVDLKPRNIMVSPPRQPMMGGAGAPCELRRSWGITLVDIGGVVLRRDLDEKEEEEDNEEEDDDDPHCSDASYHDDEPHSVEENESTGQSHSDADEASPKSYSPRVGSWRRRHFGGSYHRFESKETRSPHGMSAPPARSTSTTSLPSGPTDASVHCSLSGGNEGSVEFESHSAMARLTPDEHHHLSPSILDRDGFWRRPRSRRKPDRLCHNAKPPPEPSDPTKPYDASGDAMQQQQFPVIPETSSHVTEPGSPNDENHVPSPRRHIQHGPAATGVASGPHNTSGVVPRDKYKTLSQSQHHLVSQTPNGRGGKMAEDTVVRMCGRKRWIQGRRGYQSPPRRGAAVVRSPKKRKDMTFKPVAHRHLLETTCSYLSPELSLIITENDRQKNCIASHFHHCMVDRMAYYDAQRLCKRQLAEISRRLARHVADQKQQRAHQTEDTSSSSSSPHVTDNDEPASGAETGRHCCRREQPLLDVSRSSYEPGSGPFLMYLADVMVRAQLTRLVTLLRRRSPHHHHDTMLTPVRLVDPFQTDLTATRPGGGEDAASQVRPRCSVTPVDLKTLSLLSRYASLLHRFRDESVLRIPRGTSAMREPDALEKGNWTVCLGERASVFSLGLILVELFGGFRTGLTALCQLPVVASWFSKNSALETIRLDDDHDVGEEECGGRASGGMQQRRRDDADVHHTDVQHKPKIRPVLDPSAAAPAVVHHTPEARQQRPSLVVPPSTRGQKRPSSVAQSTQCPIGLEDRLQYTNNNSPHPPLAATPAPSGRRALRVYPQRMEATTPQARERTHQGLQKGNRGIQQQQQQNVTGSMRRSGHRIGAYVQGAVACPPPSREQKTGTARDPMSLQTDGSGGCEGVVDNTLFRFREELLGPPSCSTQTDCEFRIVLEWDLKQIPIAMTPSISSTMFDLESIRAATRSLHVPVCCPKPSRKEVVPCNTVPCGGLHPRRKALPDTSQDQGGNESIPRATRVLQSNKAVIYMSFHDIYKQYCYPKEGMFASSWKIDVGIPDVDRGLRLYRIPIGSIPEQIVDRCLTLNPTRRPSYEQLKRMLRSLELLLLTIHGYYHPSTRCHPEEPGVPPIILPQPDIPQFHCTPCLAIVHDDGHIDIVEDTTQTPVLRTVTRRARQETIESITDTTDDVPSEELQVELCF